MSKFEVGDKAVMMGGGCSTASIGETVTITGVSSKRVEFVTSSGGTCWCYHPDYLEDDHYLQLTTKGDKPMARRTFKQLVETPTVKKGAIYQEACDDGTQEYRLLDKAFNKDVTPERSIWNSGNIYNRSLVEDNPKMFVEVFKVTPEYMTQEELNIWTAFNKAATPAQRKATKRVKVSKNGKRLGRPPKATK